jgi:hypothetical protein
MPESETVEKQLQRKKGSFGSVTGVAHSGSVDMDGIFLYAMATSDQFYDATDIAADVVDPGCGKSVLDVPPDELFLPQADDLKIIHIVGFEVMLGAWGRAVQFSLQRLGNFYTHEQSLAHLNHSSLLLFSSLSYWRSNRIKQPHAEKLSGSMCGEIPPLQLEEGWIHPDEVESC